MTINDDDKQFNNEEDENPFPPTQQPPSKPLKGEGEGEEVTVVNMDGSEVVIGVDWDHHFWTIPQMQKGYPVELQGFVSEREHEEFIEEVNLEFERISRVSGRRYVLLLLHCMCVSWMVGFGFTATVTKLNGVWIGAVPSFPALIVIWVLLFCWPEPPVDHMVEFTNDLSSQKFRSRGVQYRLDGCPLAEPSQKMKVAIYFPPPVRCAK